jgi:large subunit ribosomal protein L23
MSILDRFARKQQKENLEKKVAKSEPEVKVEKKSTKKTDSVSLKKTTDKKVQTKTVKAKKALTMDVSAVLVKPLITEKVSAQAAEGKYGFVVANDTNKIQVKKAIAALYGVKVAGVRIINMKGKKVSYGRMSGRTKSWKKAIVTLAPGEKIEVYEGV